MKNGAILIGLGSSLTSFFTNTAQIDSTEKAVVAVGTAATAYLTSYIALNIYAKATALEDDLETIQAFRVAGYSTPKEFIPKLLGGFGVVAAALVAGHINGQKFFNDLLIEEDIANDSFSEVVVPDQREDITLS